MTAMGVKAFQLLLKDSLGVFCDIQSSISYKKSKKWQNKHLKDQFFTLQLVSLSFNFTLIFMFDSYTFQYSMFQLIASCFPFVYNAPTYAWKLKFVKCAGIRHKKTLPEHDVPFGQAQGQQLLDCLTLLLLISVNLVYLFISVLNISNFNVINYDSTGQQQTVASHLGTNSRFSLTLIGSATIRVFHSGCPKDNFFNQNRDSSSSRF